MEDCSLFEMPREAQIHSYLNALKQKQQLDSIKIKYHEPCELEENIEISSNENHFQYEHSQYNSFQRMPVTTKPNFFKVQGIIKRIVRLFLTKKFVRRIALLNKTKLSYINDKSVFLDYFKFTASDRISLKKISESSNILISEQEIQEPNNSQSTLKKSFNLSFFQILDYFPLIEPYSKFLVCWNIINSILKLFLVFLFSISSFFQVNIYNCENKIGYFMLYLCLLFLLLFDVFLNLNKILIKRGVFITEKKEIVKYYFKDGMLNDFLAILPIIATIFRIIINCEDQEVILQLNIPFFIHFFIYLMIANFYNSVYQLEKQFKLTLRRKLIIKLCRLIFFLVLLSHLVGCVLKFAGDFGVRFFKYDVNWMISIDDSSWEKKYLYSYYWATTTMITVGYGDITPKTSLEVMIITLIQFLGCGVFGFMINQIGSIVSDINKSKSEFENDQELLTNYMNIKQLPNQLIQRASSNLEYIHQFINKTQEKEVMKKLSSIIQEEIAQKLNQQILNKFPILIENFSKQTLEHLQFDEQIVTPGEMIPLQSQCLWLLEQGSLVVLAKPSIECRSETKIKSIDSGQIFGHLGFFTGQDESKIIIRSLNFSTLYKVSRKNILDAIKYNTNDFERFSEIQDDLIYNRNYHSLKIICEACQQSSDHQILDCPSVHLILNPISIIQKKMNEKQQRYRKKRKLLGKNFKALLQMKNVKGQIQEVKEYEYVQNLGSEYDIDSLQFQMVMSDISGTKKFSESNISSKNLNSESQYQAEDNIDPSKELDYKSLEMKSRKESLESLRFLQKNQRITVSGDQYNNSRTPQIEKFKFPSVNQIDQQFEIDKMKEFNNYFIYGNFSNSIKLYLKQSRKMKLKKVTQVHGYRKSQREPSRYSLFKSDLNFSRLEEIKNQQNMIPNDAKKKFFQRKSIRLMKI